MDTLEALANVNAIMVAVFRVSEDTAGYANQDYYPCHGSREFFTGQGLNYATIYP